MSLSDKVTTSTDELEASISDLQEYHLEVVEVDDEDDLETGCLSCS